MHTTTNDQDVQLDLWAEESDTEVAAACCAGSGSSTGTLSSPVSSTSTVGSAGSLC